MRGSLWHRLGLGPARFAPKRRGMDRRPHIVVVEDETTQRHLLVDYLARQKFRVTGVDGGMALESWWSASCQLWCCSM